MTALPGDRLVCFTDTGICDGRGEHDIRLWTDGIVAFAVCGWGEPFGEHDCTITRDTTQIEVVCGYVTGHRVSGDPITCGGHAYFELTDEAWTTDKASVDMLDKYGSVIER